MDKFIPSFKLSKFLIEEGKDKIIKKIKESLDKNSILYEEKIFLSMIPKGKKYSSLKVLDKNDPWDPLTNNLKEFIDVDQLFSFKSLESGEGEFQNVFFNNYSTGEDKKPRKVEKFSSPPQETQNHTNGYAGAPIYGLGLFYVDGEGVKLPIASKKYLVRQYNKNDFPEEE